MRRETFQGNVLRSLPVNLRDSSAGGDAERTLRFLA
jgi:hypothetical protein